MLVQLYGENFRSLRDHFELSMVAANLSADCDRNRGIINVKLNGVDEPLSLVRTVAIYGKNASGKSSVLQAAAGLRWMIRRSSSETEPGEDIRPFEPFVLDNTKREEPVRLGCALVYNKALLRYEIAFTANEIVNERLTQHGECEITLIDRQQNAQVRGDLVEHSDANKLYVKGMQPNVSVLSKLARHGPSHGKDSAIPYYDAILSATKWQDYSMHAFPWRWGPHGGASRFADDKSYRNWIMTHLITQSDVGICDVQVRPIDIEIPEQIRSRIEEDSGGPITNKAIEVEFVHQGESKRGIDFSEESSGTRKIFNVSHDWWRLSHEEVTIIADELGASLHPRLLDSLVRAVNALSPEEVPSQLVFATHETGLLESRDGMPAALRRDQVYFTEKGHDGASTLYSLCEFGDDARSVHNIRKRYLSGRYGAIPMVEGISL